MKAETGGANSAFPSSSRVGDELTRQTTNYQEATPTMLGPDQKLTTCRACITDVIMPRTAPAECPRCGYTNGMPADQYAEERKARGLAPMPAGTLREVKDAAARAAAADALKDKITRDFGAGMADRCIITIV